MRRLAILALVVSTLASAGHGLSAQAEHAAQQATLGPAADAYVSSANRRSNFGRERLLRIQGRPVFRSYIRFTVRATATRWSERRITFANAPRPSGPVARSGRLRRLRWASIDVTRLVRGNGTVSLALTGSSSASLASRESGSTRPRLVVETKTAAPATLVAAGDIATCGSDGQVQTAALVDAIPGTVAALGDLAYENGTPQEFASCYEPSWGRFKARTRPVP